MLQFIPYIILFIFNFYRINKFRPNRDTKTEAKVKIIKKYSN